MTPKEKAEEFLYKFLPLVNQSYAGVFENAKQCALIACQEVIDCLEDDNLYADGENSIGSIIKYWKQVKTELENLK